MDMAAVLAQDVEAVEEVLTTQAQQVHPRKVYALLSVQMSLTMVPRVQQTR